MGFDAWIGPQAGLSDDDYLYGAEGGPWPMMNPLHAELWPAIGRIPQAYTRDFRAHVVQRYINQVKYERPKVALKMLFGIGRHVQPLSDEEFARHLFTGVFAKILSPELSERDRADFAAYLPATPAAGEPVHFKVDLTPMDRTLPMPKLHAAPTVTLMRKTSSCTGEPVAIRLNDVVLDPKDGHAWDLAKYYVMMGMMAITTLTKHPRTHFPMDVITAVSLTALPKKHLVFKLVHAHSRVQLAINRRVVFSPDSVGHNNQFLPYTPYTTWGNVPAIDGAKGFPGHILAGYAGVEGNSSYPAYLFPREPEKIWTDYGDFLQAYYETFREFVTPVVARIPRDDPHVRYWADTIASWLPGFPDGDQIFAGDTLARALSFFMWDVSVAHCADHYSIGSHYRLDVMPMRIRIPPPASKTIPAFDRRKMTSFGDTLRYRMAMMMYFGPPASVELLHDTWYGFDDPELDGLNRTFLDRLKETERTLPCQNYMPLHTIARGIQF